MSLLKSAIIGLLVLLAGCSSVRLGYGSGPLLAWWWLDGYVDFSRENAPLAQIYIVAHEWGHHIQNQTGAMGQANRQDTGPLSDGVRLELQADCYAGMFVGEAASTVDPDTGTTFLVPPTREEVQSALDAAAAVGDDHIQSQSGQVTNPESWTHGSSESRMNWFATGYEQGSMQACDTFATDDL